MLPYLIMVGLGALLSACSSDQDGPKPAHIPYPENIPPKPKPKPVDPLAKYEVDQNAQKLWEKITTVGVSGSWVDRGTLYLSTFPNQGNSYVSGKGDGRISLQEVYTSIFDSAHPRSFTQVGLGLGSDLFKNFEEEILADPESRTFYGLALAQHPDQPVGALMNASSIFREGIEKNPDNASLHWNLGYVHHVRGDLGLAMASYLKALALDSKISDHTLDGLLLEMDQNENMERAISVLLSYTHANPDSAMGFHFLGKAQKIAGRLRHAKASLTKALQLDPNHHEARVTLGDLFFQMEQYDQAALHYQRAIREKVQDPKIYFRLSEILEHRGGSLNLARAMELRVEGRRQKRNEVLQRGDDE